MPADLRFAETLIEQGPTLKLRSQCLRCGETRIVSVMDGSLEGWHAEHRCEEIKRPSERVTEAAPEKRRTTPATAPRRRARCRLRSVGLTAWTPR